MKQCKTLTLEWFEVITVNWFKTFYKHRSQQLNCAPIKGHVTHQIFTLENIYFTATKIQNSIIDKTGKRDHNIPMRTSDSPIY